jgi:hypothetical protein
VFLYLFKQNYLSLLKWVDFLWLVRQFVSLLLNQSDCLLNDVSVCVWIYKEIYWVIYCYMILIYLFTCKIKLSESCVWFQCFSKWFSSIWINPIHCWMMCQCVWIYKEIYWVIYFETKSQSVIKPIFKVISIFTLLEVCRIFFGFFNW